MPSTNEIVSVKLSGTEPYDPSLVDMSSPVWEGRALNFGPALFSILITGCDSIEVKVKFQK